MGSVNEKTDFSSNNESLSPNSESSPLVKNQQAEVHDLKGHSSQPNSTDAKTIGVVKQTLLDFINKVTSKLTDLKEHVSSKDNRYRPVTILQSKTSNVASKNLSSDSLNMHHTAPSEYLDSLPDGIFASQIKEQAPLIAMRSELISLEHPDTEKRVLTGNQDPNWGKSIRYEYKENGVHLGTEIIDRTDVVTDHAKLLNEMKANFVKDLRQVVADLRNVKLPEDQKKSLEGQAHVLTVKIRTCERELNGLENVDKTFIHSNYIRNKLEDNRQKGHNFEESVHNLCQGMPVNMRKQHVEVKGEKLGSHFRLGVMAFHGNTHTNLEEMKYMKEKDIGRKDQKLKQLDVSAKSDKKTARERESLAYAHNQIKDLNESIIERETILQMQFMHLLKGQAVENKSQFNNPNKDFTICHLAFLNPQTSELDPTGWMHDEANEILDMKAIFDTFNEKEMVFDGKGEMPILGSDDKIHMPASLAPKDAQNQKRTLQTIFMNISVQGHTKNDGMQMDINRQGIGKLINYARDKVVNDKTVLDGLISLIKIDNRLEQKESNYQLAEDLGVALNDIGIPFSDGCLSGKDRTGFVSARLMLRVMMEQHSDLPEKENIEKKLANSILEPDKPAAKVVEDNTEATELKLTPLNLPGIDKTTRAWHYLKVAEVSPLPQPIRELAQSIVVLRPKTDRLEKLSESAPASTIDLSSSSDPIIARDYQEKAAHLTELSKIARAYLPEPQPVKPSSGLNSHDVHNLSQKVSDAISWLPVVASPLAVLTSTSDITGIAGAALEIFADAGAAHLAVKDLNLHNRWIRQIDPKTEGPIDPKTVIDNLKSDVKNAHSLDEINKLLNAYGLDAKFTKITEILNRLNEPDVAMQITNHLQGKNALNKYSNEFNIKLGAKLEKEFEHKLAQKMLENDFVLKLKEKVKNHPEKSSKELREEVTKEIGDEVAKEISDEVAKEMGEAAQVRNMNKTATSMLTTMHKVNHKILKFDVAKTFAVLGTAVVTGVTRIAVQIATLAGGITAPVTLILSPILAAIPMAVKVVGEGIRLAFVARQKPATVKETLKLTSQRVSWHTHRLSSAQSKLNKQIKVIEHLQTHLPAKTNKPSPRLFGRIKTLDEEMAKLEKTKQAVITKEKIIETLKQQQLSASWKDMSRHMKVSESYSDSGIDRLKEQIPGFITQITSDKLTDAQQRFAIRIKEGIRTAFENNPMEYPSALETILNSNDSDQIKTLLDQLPRPALQQLIREFGDLPGNDYTSHLAEELIGQLEGKKLSSETITLLQRQMGVNVAKIYGESARPKMALARAIKEKLTMDDREVMKFIRQQREEMKTESAWENKSAFKRFMEFLTG